MKFLRDVAGDDLEPNLESDGDFVLYKCENEEADNEPQEDDIAACRTSTSVLYEDPLT